MIEPVSVPIYLDVDISTEEYDLDVETPIVVSGGGGIAYNGLPPGGDPGDILIKQTEEDYKAEWIPPATSVEQDNTRPITAAAVYTEIGNINALLATI